jgi:hypothetical protein
MGKRWLQTVILLPLSVSENREEFSVAIAGSLITELARTYLKNLATK